MEHRAVKRTGIVGGAALAIVLLGAGALWRVHRQAPRDAAGSPDPHAPAGVRVRVSVVNGTKTRGLARHATMLLRDRGFDVVDIATDNTPRDTTIVYDLTGHADWAKRIARGFTPSRVETKPDSSRYLDIIVVLGTTWRPPAKPFYP